MVKKKKKKLCWKKDTEMCSSMCFIISYIIKSLHLGRLCQISDPEIKVWSIFQQVCCYAGIFDCFLSHLCWADLPCGVKEKTMCCQIIRSQGSGHSSNQRRRRVPGGSFTLHGRYNHFSRKQVGCLKPTCCFRLKIEENRGRKKKMLHGSRS